MKKSNIIDDLVEENRRLKKINSVLLQRIETSTSYSNDSFSLFHHAVSLEAKVKERTDELNQTLLQLKKRSFDLEKAKEQAEAASNTKSEFLATMSHEIRTPMNGVLGMTELILNSELNPKQHRQATTAHRSAKALLSVINNILDFSKIEAGKLKLVKEDFSLTQLLDDIFEMFSDQVERKGLKLQLVVSQSIPDRIHGDSTRLRQIIVNLLGNAIKFTQKGKVCLCLTVDEQTNKKINLRFDVIDTGPGISASMQTDIFNAFTQADSSSSRQYGGTGLGLAITHKLVSLMNGKIKVSSYDGNGSCFSFYVQMATSEEVDFSELKSDIKINNKYLAITSKRILIAEDNLINQEVAIGMLEDLNCNVTVVNNGLEAIDAFNKHNYDLILMDCHMPVLDGFDAADSIRRLEQQQEQTKTPIIALTADIQKGIEKKCQAVGMNGYMSKPFTKESLLTALKQWLPLELTDSNNESDDEAPVKQHNNTNIIDKTPLEKLHYLGRKRGKDTLGNVLKLFLNDASLKMEQLNIGVTCQDFTTVTEIAHSLKSSSATVGAYNLSRACEKMEAAGLDHNTEILPALLSTLKNDMYDAKVELNAILTEHKRYA